MPFHVEISATSMRHARAFNLGEDELRTDLEPWMTDRTIELGDREWVPRESALKILEGPRLEGPDLAFGQGWSNAERSASDVTREMLARPEQRPPAPHRGRGRGRFGRGGRRDARRRRRATADRLAAAQAAVDRRDLGSRRSIAA